jgi:hypothetical protein
MAAFVSTSVIADPIRAGLASWAAFGKKDPYKNGGTGD